MVRYGIYVDAVPAGPPSLASIFTEGGPPMTAKSSFSSLVMQAKKAGFPSLYTAEKLLLRKFVGQENPQITAVAGGENENEEASKDGPKWGRKREVRAGLIRMLCTNKVVQTFADPHGISLEGARITDPLDLTLTSIPFPLTLRNCYFDKAPRFFQVTVPELNLEKSFAPGLDAELITVKGHFTLQNFTTGGGEVNLRLCHVTGNLVCSGATFSNPDRMNTQGKPDEESGTALAADGAIIDGYVLLTSASDRPFRSEGEVSFLGAQIRGDLDCHGGRFIHLPHPDFPDRGVALSAERANVKGSVFLRDGFESQGEIRLHDAQIGGSLGCEGGHFENKAHAGADEMVSALTLLRASVAGTARFADDDAKRHCQVIGYLSMVDSRFGGVLEMDGAHFKSASLDLSGASASLDCLTPENPVGLVRETFI